MAILDQRLLILGRSKICLILFSGRNYVPFYYWSKICPLYLLVEKVSVDNMSVEKTSRCLTSNQTIVAYCVANFYVRMPINSLYCKISAFEKNNWKRIIVVFSSTLIQIALSSNKSHFDQHEGPYIWNSHSISTGNTGCLFKEDSRTRWLLCSFHYFLLSVK